MIDLRSPLKHLIPHRRPVCCVALMLVMCAARSHARGDELSIHPFESFTRPNHQIEVAAREPGRVESVHIKRGDRVSAGEVLFKLDSAVLEATRQVYAAEAEATARIEGLQVEYDLQLRRAGSFRSLHEGGRGSLEELFRAEADAKIALANLKVAQEEQHQHRLKLAEIEARIAARSVTSPIDGIVTDVRKEPGEYVAGASPEVATIVDLSRIRASFFLSTAVTDGLSESQRVRVAFLNTGQTASGVVEHIGVVTEADSGRVRVDVIIDNSDHAYRSGVRCRLLQENEQPPPTAQLSRSNRTFD